MLTRGRKRKRGYGTFEREMVNRDSAREVGQNRLAVLIDREQKVPLGRKGDSGDIRTVREWESVRLIA